MRILVIQEKICKIVSQKDLARKQYDISQRSSKNIPGFVKSDEELRQILGQRDLQKRYNELSQNFFNKQYEDLTRKDIQLFAEELISNLGLIKKRQASNFDEIILFLLSHEQTTQATRNNILIALDIFEIDTNKFYVGDHVYEVPPFYLHKNYLN